MGFLEATRYVNIADAAQIVVLRAAEPTRVANFIPMPVNGPHGLDLDRVNRRLFCACDGGKLVVVEVGTDGFSSGVDLSGVPDVIFSPRDPSRSSVCRSE